MICPGQWPSSWSSRYQSMWPCYKTHFLQNCDSPVAVSWTQCKHPLFPPSQKMLIRATTHVPTSERGHNLVTSETKDKGLVHSQDIWWMWRRPWNYLFLHNLVCSPFPEEAHTVVWLIIWSCKHFYVLPLFFSFYWHVLLQISLNLYLCLIWLNETSKSSSNFEGICFPLPHHLR